jgi:hypothetical protein
MGWFEDGSGNLLGDVALDELRNCLVSVAAEYQEAARRPPTLDELRMTLLTVLANVGSDLVGELDTQEVSAIQIKTRKRPTKQKWDTGDHFLISLPDRSFAFGRILWRRQPKKGAGVVEVFRHRSRSPVLRDEIMESGRAVYPFNVNGVFTFEEGRWRIIGRTPDFRAPDHDEIRLYSDFEDTADVFDIDFKCVSRDIPIADVPKNAIDMTHYRHVELPDLEQYVLENTTAPD